MPVRRHRDACSRHLDACALVFVYNSDACAQAPRCLMQAPRCLRLRFRIQFGCLRPGTAMPAAGISMPALHFCIELRCLRAGTANTFEVICTQAPFPSIVLALHILCGLSALCSSAPWHKERSQAKDLKRKIWNERSQPRAFKRKIIKGKISSETVPAKASNCKYRAKARQKCVKMDTCKIVFWEVPYYAHH